MAAVPRTNDTPDQSGPTKLSTHAPGVYDDGNVFLPYCSIPRIVLSVGHTARVLKTQSTILKGQNQEIRA